MLDKRLEAIELVAKAVEPNVALHAIDHLIAFPDEEKKLNSLLGLTSATAPPVKEKIDDYLTDYLAFIKDAEECYPEVAREISPETKFRLRYFEMQQNGDFSRMKRLLGMLQKTSPLYNQALLLYGLHDDDPDIVRNTASLMDARQLIETVKMTGEALPTSYDILYPIAGALLKSSDGATRGVEYLWKIAEEYPEKAEEVFALIEENGEQIIQSSAGRELCKKLSQDLYDENSDKESIMLRALVVDDDAGVNLAKKFAATKDTFEEVSEVADIVLSLDADKYLQETVDISELALKKGRNYQNAVKLAKKFLESEGNADAEACSFFEEALEMRANMQQREEVADYLLRNEFYDLAEEFYSKTLEKSTKIDNYKRVAVKLMGARLIDSSKEVLHSGSKHIKSFAQFVDLYNDFVGILSEDEKNNVAVQGIKLTETLDDYFTLGGFLAISPFLEEDEKFSSLVYENFEGDVQIDGNEQNGKENVNEDTGNENVYQKKLSLMQKVLPFQNKIGLDLAARLAESHQEYEQIVGIAKLILAYDVGQAVEALEKARSINDSYQSNAEIALLLIDGNCGEQAVDYLKSALQKEAKPRIFKDTAEKLFARNLFRSAAPFYDKTLKKRKTPAMVTDIAQKFLDAKQNAIAQKFLDYIGKPADTFGKYFVAYRPLMEVSEIEHTSEILIEGLTALGSTPDYKMAFDFVTSNYGKGEVWRFVQSLKDLGEEGPEVKEILKIYEDRIRAERNFAEQEVEARGARTGPRLGDAVLKEILVTNPGLEDDELSEEEQLEELLEGGDEGWENNYAGDEDAAKTEPEDNPVAAIKIKEEAEKKAVDDLLNELEGDDEEDNDGDVGQPDNFTVAVPDAIKPDFTRVRREQAEEPISDEELDELLS